MIIGRKKEIQLLNKTYKSASAEFIVLYGRRRIGKTYLIREYFSKLNCHYLHATGLQKGTLKKQLMNFTESLAHTFASGIEIKPPASWEDAFKMLNKFIENASPKKKTVIFMDEVPWMATRKSGFLEAIDYYWNRYWSAKSNVILIICGSSASWLIKNIIYNQGGLHNRCTCEIKLNPFDLNETSEYLTSKNIKLNRRHILEIYMSIGGVPYYLNYIEPGLSAAENIQNMIFNESAPLRNEFSKLFKSLFNSAAAHIELIKLIAMKKEGMSRAELEEKSKLSPGGGRLTQRLINLEQTSFIEKHTLLDKQRGEYYKVIDEFSLFYLHWLSSPGTKRFTTNHWILQSQKPAYHAWAGYAFEAVCLKHVNEIIKALKIKAAENISSWRMIARDKNKKGAQIDLVIDRNDDAITLCEIKYTDKPFSIDKAYASILENKISAFKEVTGTKKHIFLAIISANNIKHNTYSKELIDGIATLDDLFD